MKTRARTSTYVELLTQTGGNNEEENRVHCGSKSFNFVTHLNCFRLLFFLTKPLPSWLLFQVKLKKTTTKKEEFSSHDGFENEQDGGAGWQHGCSFLTWNKKKYNLACSTAKGGMLSWANSSLSDWKRACWAACSLAAFPVGGRGKAWGRGCVLHVKMSTWMQIATNNSWVGNHLISSP